MSIVADQVRRVDSQLDRLQLASSKSAEWSTTLLPTDATLPTVQRQNLSSSARIVHLQSVIKALSTTSSSNPLLSSWRIQDLLRQADLSDGMVQAEDNDKSAYEIELEWLLVSKATVQTYGLILKTLLEQTLPLNNDIWYWDEVVGSYSYTGLYMLQTSPLRFWKWTQDIYKDARTRFRSLREDPEEIISAREIGTSLTSQWRQFYGLVRESIHDRSVMDLQRRVLSPIALARTEARRKQVRLKRLREMSASGLGVLMDEGLNFDVDEEGNDHSRGRSGDSHEWKDVVERSVALMDMVLQKVTSLETGVPDFEDAVFASVANDPEISSAETVIAGSRPTKISKRLSYILNVDIANHITNSNRLASEYGRPSRLVRYWIPATLALLSSTTILRIVTNRKQDIITWISDFGVTVRDFWMNWVIEPTKKVVASVGSRELNESQVAEIRAKVKEGDLTPVLLAYEKDLRKPFIGTVRGDLIRTLLIQVQKTKVDVEVAISGIDALLKSQELVFGFIGLTPGVLVCIGAFRYLGEVFGNRKGQRHSRKAGQMIRVLRNIDRILTLCTPSPNGMLSYKDHGLLLCELHILRSNAKKLFPGEIEREFAEDVDELGNISIGIERQQKVLKRIRWAYEKWLYN